MLCTPKHCAVNIALHRNLHRIEETCPCHGPFVGKSVASQEGTLDVALCEHRDLPQVINATQTAVNGELDLSVIAKQNRQSLSVMTHRQTVTFERVKRSRGMCSYPLHAYLTSRRLARSRSCVVEAKLRPPIGSAAPTVVPTYPIGTPGCVGPPHRTRVSSARMDHTKKQRYVIHTSHLANSSRQIKVD